MKIRAGFVSNSSSANFVVSNYYKTVFDLAKAMLQIRSDDSESWIDTETPSINKAIRDGRDPNSSIHFSTCNYDTFIRQTSDYYIVTTCNNHPFLRELKGVIAAPEYIRMWLIENDYVSDHHDDTLLSFTEFIDTWAFQIGEVFWSPEYDLEISRYDYLKAQREGGKNVIAYCKDGDHFSDMMILSPSGKIICPVCYSRERDNQEPPIDSRFDILDL